MTVNYIRHSLPMMITHLWNPFNFLILIKREEKSSRIKNAFEGLKILPQVTGFQAMRCRLCAYCWFSHDVTKIQTKKLSILPRFYFHDALEQLKTNLHTNFRFKRVLGFVIELAWTSKLLREVAFTWRPRELSYRLKKWHFRKILLSKQLMY